MKISELHQKTKKELLKILQESREHLRLLHFNLALGKVRNVREARRIKKDIAKILTLLNEQRTKNNKQITS
ncbi:MAG TPA: 50S ribosomal protein L29 [Candidatus Nealsonbacteria bacterium]|uniref:50S ribosomal protein L29 n=1 Tax=marine sediment metagenome TaxID=412755 RepID=A0A0F9XN49_9ZZZZ|nr:50S ribosomal protein L29 [Candidatus Nealsonbacteria bacterium]HEB46356.1 50S ribosomal protein L29 [Candidatus Nealsonbacteria bacterium]